MDSGPGRCWVCDGLGKLWCSGCRFALYCSLVCQKKDKPRHVDECFNSSRRRVHCSYCGRDEALGGVPCTDCLVCCYCSESCRKMDAKNHRPICQKAKEKVLEATKKIGDWNRRAKGIPQYLGRLIHAVDYLRWSDNEGSKAQTSANDSTGQKKSEKKKDDRESSRKSRRTTEEPGNYEGNPLRILLLGADLKHVLRTLHDTPDSCTQGIDITLLDSSPHILARDLLILYLLMLPDAPTPLQDQSMLKAHAERVVMVFYSLSLDMESHALLCNTLHNLLNMTYKSFLHEMRQQVYIDAVSYTLVQKVWSGWMSFANDPSAMQKLEKVRTLKMSTKVVKDVLSRYVKSCPKDYQRGISDWIKRGSLKKQKGGPFPNVTLTCFSPLKKEYLDRFDDVSPKWSEETEWIKAISPEDDMIYAPHGIDMLFQDWDFVLVSKYFKKESNVIDMYLKFLTQVFKKSSQKLLISNQISINFLRVHVKDIRKSIPLLNGKFDRIGTGIHADLLGTPYVLQELGSLLNTENTYSKLLTHHRVWSLCFNWQHDQQAREMCQKCVKNNKPPDPLMMLTSRWSIFRQFLQAELLHHLHMIDGRPIELENILPFREISHAYDMILSDYSHHLNRIIPFRFRPEKRMVSMVDSRLHTLEWRRVGRSRKCSAPAPVQPKPLQNAQNSEGDPASRYVDNLISVSKCSPIPSPTNSDGHSANRVSSREGSLSPCPTEQSGGNDNRISRSRSTNRSRPRSLYVSTRCKSPLLSSEFDFWEQQKLSLEKNKSKSVPCTEIPVGVKNKAQLSIEAELKQAKARAKSAPASPQTKCKPRMVKEKANAFERGSSSRSTFPETRKPLDAITPSTPVKKLVLMFSKAFTSKEKDIHLEKQFQRSKSFHGHRASYEQGDKPGSISKDYENALKVQKSKNAIESGMCTLPRKSRPHSIEVSKFAYLEGCIDKKIEAINKATKEAQYKDKKKKEIKIAQNVKDSQHGNANSRKGHISPIQNLIAGLNTISVSPVMPRAAKSSKKNLKDTITVKREELRLVNLRPGSPHLPSPVSSSPTFDGVEAIDWPESHHQYLEKGLLKKSSSDCPRRTQTGSPITIISTSPRKSHSPTPSNTSTIPRMFSNLKNSLKKIPNEPEYVAPPLLISKSPIMMSHSPSSPRSIGHQYDQHSRPSTPNNQKGDKATKLEDIFSPKSSPSASHEDLHRSMEKDAKSQIMEQCSGLKIHIIMPDIENKNSTKGNIPDSKGTEFTQKGTSSPKAKRIEMQKSIQSNQKEKELILPEDLMAMTSASMSVSLREADQEVSDLFQNEESFSPIKPGIESNRGEPNIVKKDDENFVFPVNDSADSMHQYKHNHSASVSDYIEAKKKEMGQIDFEVLKVEKMSRSEKESVHKDITEANSPSIIEPHSSQVYKIVERFGKHIIGEQELLERPESPKSYNVLKNKNSRTKAERDGTAQGKEMNEKAKSGNLKNKSNAQDIECCNKPTLNVSDREKYVRKDNDNNIAQSPREKVSPKINSGNNTAPKMKTIKSKESEDIARIINFEKHSPRLSSSLRSTPVRELLTPVKDLTIPIKEYSIKIMRTSSATPVKEKAASSNETPKTPIKECSSPLVKNVVDNKRSTKKHGGTPVNVMVEKFAQEIEAQSFPNYPATERPHSIGTLIQKDFLRLYAENTQGDTSKPEDDIPEDSSLLSDLCEETMFDTSDDEEQETEDIIGIAVEKSLHLKKKAKHQKKNQIMNKAEDKPQQEPKTELKEGKQHILIASPSKEMKSRIDVPLKREKTWPLNSKESLIPKQSRSEELRELRHEFLQKIRGISDSPVPRAMSNSPIPPSKKKYGEIKATLSKRKNEMMQGERFFANDGNTARSANRSPKLEDMAIINYNIKVDSDSITDQLRTPPITRRDGPGGAIGLLADFESQGLDGDSQELCSGEYKFFDDTLVNIGNRNSSSSQSVKFYTLPRKSKSNRIDSQMSPTHKMQPKQLITESDISQHQAQLQKSSRIGGMDKMTFRQFVKASIANERHIDAQTETKLLGENSQVIEYTSGAEISAEELESNPEEVEEAIEAMSMTSEDDELPNIINKHNLNYILENEDKTRKLTRSPNRRSPNFMARRKRLPSCRSPTDIQNDPNRESRYSTDDSDNDDEMRTDAKKYRSLKRHNNKSKDSNLPDHLRMSPLTLSYSDDARQSPDSPGLNFRVEIPDMPIDSNRDIRRFMWGSLKKKYRNTKVEKEYMQEYDVESENDNTRSTLDAHTIFGERGSINKRCFSDESLIHREARKNKKMSQLNKYKNLEHEKQNLKIAPGATQVDRASIDGRNKTKSLEIIFSDSPTAKRKNVEKSQKSLPIESPRLTKRQTIRIPESSNGHTAPTIIAMVPKNRAGSPVVGIRLSRDNTKSSIKSSSLTKRDKQLSERSRAQSAERISHMSRSLSGNDCYEINRNESPMERPRSWAGAESLDGITIHIRDDSPSQSMSPRDIGYSIDVASLDDDNEVFIDNEELQQLQHENTGEQVEVRPRPGVLKNGRDRSRESRRSLRVSWGDLPERVTTPSPPTDCEGDDEQEDENHQNDKYVAWEGRKQEFDDVDNGTFRVTQL